MFAIAVLIALLIPPIYRARAILLIAPVEISADPAHTQAKRQVDQRLQLIGQRVLTADRLGGLIERYDLYPHLRRRGHLDMAVMEMRRHIAFHAAGIAVPGTPTGRAQKAEVRCLLSFEDRSAGVVQAVTQELVSLFLNDNPQHRPSVNQADDSLHLKAERLAAEIKALKARLTAVEQLGIDQQTLNVLRRDYETAMTQYREIREQSLQTKLLQSLEREHQGERFSLLEHPGVPQRGDTANRLAILVLGLLLAGVVGVSHLKLLEHLDQRRPIPGAVQPDVPLPLLAIVPYAKPHATVKRA
ncbi:MAG: hypothetical protein ACUVQI_10945 [Thermochromatium sp.]